MRFVLLALVAGCGFQITTGSAVDDANPSDGSGTGDAAMDSPILVDGLPDTLVMPVETCDVLPTGSPLVGALLGGTGQRSGDLTCDDDQVGIGLQFDVTPRGISNHGNHILMTTIRLWCGTIKRDSTNQMVTSNMTAFSYTALQGSSPTACDAYKPPAALGQVMCPSGSALVAISGHQVDSTLYNAVSIQCAAVTTSGQISTSIVTIAMPGTGTNTTMSEQTQCPASMAITSIHATSGCGQDGATASCKATQCQEDE